MEIIRANEAPIIRDSPDLQVQEYDFADPTLNDARIAINSRYPVEGYAANRICTALVSVEEGAGSITIKNKPTTDLAVGDRILIPPDEPYCFLPIGELVIRYVSTPAWAASQAYAVE
jgi:hypothetical protein